MLIRCYLRRKACTIYRNGQESRDVSGGDVYNTKNTLLCIRSFLTKFTPTADVGALCIIIMNIYIYIYIQTPPS